MGLFSNYLFQSLSSDYHPRKPGNFQVERVFLARGSLTTPERIRFVEKICALYPEAEIIECPDLAHNRIDLGEKSALKRHYLGKKTLVFGEHQSAVRRSEEAGNACPNYWHFSPYSFCFYGCNYCYLAGTPSFWHSPAVRIFLNLEEILHQIDQIAGKFLQPTSFYLGKLQDGLALDPLTGYSKILVPFFAQHKFARQIILTKSAEVENLVSLEHRGHTIISWSLNPPEVSAGFEENLPSIEERVKAMRGCAERGYPVRAVIMPMIPVKNWEIIYRDFIQGLLASVPLQRLTLGGICSYLNAKKLMELKLGKGNEISRNMDYRAHLPDGRIRYPRALRLKMYSLVVQIVRKIQPELELALCLEDLSIWRVLGLKDRVGRCNCVL